jgi:hypothetical protein
MQTDNKHLKKVKVLINVYDIQLSINSIIKEIHSLPDDSELKKLILESKLARFKPYLDNLCKDIRDKKP